MNIHNIMFNTTEITVNKAYINTCVRKSFVQANRNTLANLSLGLIAAVGAAYLTIQLAPLALPAALLSSKVLFSVWGISATTTTVTKIALGILGFLITKSVFSNRIINTFKTTENLIRLANTIRDEYQKDTITDLESQLEEKNQEIEELKKAPKEIEEEEEEEEEINNNDKNIEEPLNNNKKDD